MATLKVEENIWNYLPNVNRTMKVPAGMMSGAWMGSHFSNNDLVRGARHGRRLHLGGHQPPRRPSRWVAG